MKKLATFLYFTFCIFILSLPKDTFGQNVGIGTTTPEGLLHVKGTNWTKAILENNTGDPRGYFGIDNNGTITIGANAYWNGSTWIYPNNGSSLYLLFHRLNQRYEFRVRPEGGSQATAMTIDTGSNVVIGGNLVIDQENDNTGTIGNTLRFGNFSGEGIGSKRNAGTGQYGLDFYTNSINRMSVANNGNVGIGTITPQNTLDINGAIRIGSNSINQAGSIRYNNNNKFEGYNGSEWNSFDRTPAGTLVGSSVYPDNNLLNNGYVYKGQLPNVLQQQTTTGVSANTWLSTSTQAVVDPGYRKEHTAVWTGTEMIVWGGSIGSGVVSDGARYKSELNLWTPTNNNNAPSPRTSHTAVWTGTEMIVWGGRYNTYTPGTGYLQVNSGSKYNSASDSWAPVTNTNAPSIRSEHTAVWTGTEMIVWGGQFNQGDSLNIPLNTGAKYNPSTNTWTAISTVNAPAARYRHSAIWTGTEMIIWGGTNAQINANFGGTVAGGTLNTGAKYNPATNTWTTISAVNAPTGRYFHTTVWSGTEMIIWGGIYRPDMSTFIILNTGSKYNAATNTWTTMSNTNASGAVAGHNAVWTGSNMLVWGGTNGESGGSYVAYQNVYTYTPSSNSWVSVNAPDPPSGRDQAAMIWTGTHAIVFGGSGGGILNTGGRFFPASQPTYNNSVQVNGTIYLYSKQ